MTTNNILLLLVSLLIAGSFSYFQYIYKAKNKSKVGWFLAFLRFLSIFCILLLLINPIITTKTLEIVKTPLPLVVDNSTSIAFLKSEEKIVEIFKKLQSNKDLQQKFNVQSYQFSSDFEPSDTFNFNGIQSNIDVVATSLKSIYKNQIYPTILITDGNQTSGNDYVYSFDDDKKVYPVIVGDTTTFLDFKINQLNVNKYAFHKNKFPVEAFLNYSGTKNITADFIISQGNSFISKQSIAFSPSRKTATVNVLLPAEKIGLQVFKASISSREKEKNIFNNNKNFAVEVIDQKTNIAIISSISHPDLGTLKRAIESNVQRKVTIVKPTEIKSLQDYNVLILYQPTTDFKTIFDTNKKLRINTFVITGNSTDFNFLNQQQNNFIFKMSGGKEDYLSVFNTQFNLFSAENIGFENFPPLQNTFGTINIKDDVSVLLSSKIRNIETRAPILAFTENQGSRAAYLLGENSWKWRLQTHVNNQSFEKFDIFIDKIIQFLASKNTKQSLVVEHDRFYNFGDAIEITAKYFNKNYEFDEKARLTIRLTNSKTKEIKDYDLLKGNNIYKVNLDGLGAGSYKFSVKELNSNSTYSSSFEILDFDIEKQFINPDVEKLSQLASHTKGKEFYPDQIDALVKVLLENDDYKAIQKDIVSKAPLIDWIWLLILISIALASEWFVRKYNGLL
jgi:hypothetical protein